MNAYFNIRILLVFIYDRFTQLFTFQNWRGKYEHNALGVFMELISTIILTGVQNQFKTQYMCQTNEDQTHPFISNEADPGKHFLGCSYLSYMIIRHTCSPSRWHRGGLPDFPVKVGYFSCIFLQQREYAWT